MAQTKEKKYLIDNEELMKEWDWEKNEALGLDPSKLTCGSGKKAWWVCEKGHSWETQINVRIKGYGCPYCSGLKAISGVNDLQTVNPSLAKEWNFEKNDGLTPLNVMPNSNKKVWWKCQYGHEWQSTINHRSNGRGCSVCNKWRQTSFPEQAIFYYIGMLTKAENRYLYNKKTEIDIFLPEYNVGIEYDGFYYHTRPDSKRREIEKDNLLKSNGIRIIRIKEIDSKYTFIDSDDIIYCVYHESYNYLKDVILKLILRIGIDVDNNYINNINVKKDTLKILSLYSHYKSTNIFENFSFIIDEWHPTKNNHLMPEMFDPTSHKIVWWLGKCGHEWTAAIKDRKLGYGCPICNGKRILIGFNDLESNNMELANEWNYKKNGIFLPNMVTPNSGRKVWWTCNVCKHEWKAKIADRSKGCGCPMCAEKKGTLKYGKQVRCIETNIIYNSMYCASKETGIHSGGISACCKGKCKTAGGCHWEFVTENEN